MTENVLEVVLDVNVVTLAPMVLVYDLSSRQMSLQMTHQEVTENVLEVVLDVNVVTLAPMVLVLVFFFLLIVSFL